MIWLAALSFAAWIYLLAGHGRFWQAGPTLQPPPPPDRAMPRICIVVPARNEAESIVACLRSLLAQDYPGPFRVILVDDLSSDGTGPLAEAIGDPRLRVMRGAAHPPGWSGKLWALSQGIEAAGDAALLLLTDADIVHAPSHLTTLVTQLEAHALDMASEMVALHCASAAERALVPPFVFFFQMLYPFEWVNDHGNPMAAAAGGTVLIRAASLAAAGGLSAMRGALIDDVTLARRIKKTGRIWLGHSALATSIRPYRNAADIWRMVARCAFVQLNHSAWLLAATVAGMALVWLLPPLAALFGHGLLRAVGLLGWAAMTVSYLPTLKRFALNPFWAICLPAAALFYTAATLGSALDHYRGRGRDLETAGISRMSLTLDSPEDVEAWSGKDRGQENFPVGSLLVRPGLRPHVHAFYAFARNADDIADSPDLAPADKLARLGVMEAVLRGDRAAGSPSATGLRRSLSQTGVTDRHALDLLAAFRQDATKTRYASWDELFDYCRLSAMPVGRHVLDLHGEAPDCTGPSDALSAALQVLNHLQDLAADLAGLDRCYVPQDLLAREGGATADIRGAASGPALRRVIDRLLDECDALNVEAARLPACVRDRRLRLETAVIVGLSRRLTARLRAGDPLATRVKLTRTDVAASVAGAVPSLFR